MEVFLGNLRPDGGDEVLHRLLQPVMAELSIQAKSWSCDKPRKKTFGFVTFLEAPDGMKFLDRHGELPDLKRPQRSSNAKSQPRTISRLTLMGRPVFCRKSNKKPDEYVIRALQHENDKRKAEKNNAKHASLEENIDKHAPIDFYNVVHISCGHYAFPHGQLAFISEWESPVWGTTKVNKRSLVFRLLKPMQMRIRIPIQSIYELVHSNEGNMVLTLTKAPMFLVENFEGYVDLFRDTTFARIFGLDKQHAEVAGCCLTYHIQCRGPVNVNFHEKFQKLRSRDLITMVRQHVPVYAAHQIGLRPYSSAIDEFRLLLATYSSHDTLPFGVVFHLQALVYNGYLHPTTVQHLACKLVNLYHRAADAGSLPSSEALRKLFTWVDYQGTETKPEELTVEYLLDLLHDAEAEIRSTDDIRATLLQDSPNLTPVYRAVVTPSRITLHGPELEAKNRILRKFPEHQDYFLRVQFCDEDGQALHFSPKISLDAIYDRFKSVLNRGIQVADRTYTFLGFSHSSLRARSVWFAAPFVYQGTLYSVLNILGGLGDFTGIRCPARKAARIGQAFSETPYTVPLKDNDIRVVEIPDVIRASRVFSDGVGIVSLAALENIWTYIPASKCDPTCLQIRFAGAKGMIALDANQAGKFIALRASMVKFESNDVHHLEICDAASKPIKLVLNRQIIKIMEDMGVPSQWFTDLQALELERIRAATISTSNAAHFLKVVSVGAVIDLPRLFRQIDRLGLEYRKDPFLRSIIETAVLKELRALKYKARIPVPQGVTLFGVMDESGFLREGQVYFTYDSMQGRYVPCPGSCKVIVTRSPALHPGDVQLAHNILPPNGHPLRSLSNCIVFSQHGSRDLPSQLSGGDLDGDIYNIIWDPIAVNRVQMVFQPADYPRVEPLELDREVTSEDIANFFVDFMKTDHLGVIATRHMILADQKPEGTLDPLCVELAELHSAAVDFSKSGRGVELRRLPRASKFRPDFFAPGPNAIILDRSEVQLEVNILQNEEYDSDDDGPKYKYYRSEKLLGHLYRGIDETKIWYEDIKRTVPTGGPSFWDELILALRPRWAALGQIDWEPLQNEARSIRYSYDDAIANAMTDFSDNPSRPISEVEVFVGYFLNKAGSQSGRQRDMSIKLRDEFNRIALGTSRLIRYHRTSHENEQEVTDALALAIACLHVACEGNTRSRLNTRLRTNDEGLVSFKVIAAAEVVRELWRAENGH
ncbi:rna-dependent rna polymerase [Thozetella sp. PMI_491]|nr:rna-dependent rna polymerase [Thozetella sp. PMI_491]